MKKNFILFALMVFLPVLAFAQSVTLTLNEISATYNGQDQKPVYQLSAANGNYTAGGPGATIQWLDAVYTYKFNGGEAQELTASTEFVNAGTYEIIVTRQYRTRASARYQWPNTYDTATNSKTFTIEPKNIALVSFSVSPVVFQYTGDACTPAADVIDAQTGVQLAANDVDYSLSYDKNTDPGTASAIIEGKGNYSGSKTTYFTILASNPDDVVNEIDFSEAEITLASDKVEYNGTATAARITNVVLEDEAQIFGVDYKIVGYVEKAAFDAFENAIATQQAVEVPTILAAPDHIGNWYVLVASAEGGNDPDNWAKEDFEVTQASLKIDLLEIHKIYGDPDPTLTMANINTWASVNWAPGDGPSNTTIEGIVFDRKTLGEDAYDADGNQLSYGYSLKNPQNLKAYKKIGETKYENYKVGVGQSSNLLIDKADLVVSCDTKTGNANVNVPDDWKYYNTADPVDANGSFAFKVISGLKNNDTAADAVKKVTREAGEEATLNFNGSAIDGAGEGYAFIADAPNYNVTFQDKFQIRRQDALAESNQIQVVFDPASYTYTGAAQENKPKVSYYDNIKGERKELTLGTDYTLSWVNNVNVGTATCYVTFIKNFQDKNPGDVRTLKSATFQITKANLTIKPTSLSKKVGDAEPTQAELKDGLQYTTLLGQDLVNNAPYYRNNPANEKLVAPTVQIIETANQGVYRLVIDQDAAQANIANYTVKTEEALLTYGVNQLHIYADNKEAYYGQQPDVALTAKYSFTEGGAFLTAAEAKAFEDEVLKPAGELIYSLSREEGKDAGVYDITAEGPTSISGYMIEYHKGTYTINPRPVVIKARTQEKIYGEEDPELTVYVHDGLSNSLGVDDGMQYGDKPEDVFFYTYTDWGGTQHVVPLYTVTREEGENVGSYQISVNLTRQQWYYNAGAFKNYEVTAGNDWNWWNNNKRQGYLYINKRPMKVSVVDLEKYYGENDPAYEVEFEEQTEGRGLVVRTETVTTGWGPWQQTTEVEVADEIDPRDWTISRDASRTNDNRNGEDAGEYTLEIKHAKVAGTNNDTNWNGNYTIETANGNGKLTIKKAILNVVAKDQGIDYGKDINKTFITNAAGEKIYAYDWEIEEGQMVNANLPIEKKNNPKTLNDKIEELISLEAKTTKVGYHKPADEPYELVKTPLCEKNYEVNFTQAYLTISPLQIIPLDKNVTVYEDVTRPLYQVLDDHQGASVIFTMPSNRAFKANTWYTLVLPFDIKVRDLSSALGYAVVDIFDQNNNSGDVKMKLHVQDIKANEPFIVKVDEDITKDQMKNINFGGKKKVVATLEGGYAEKDAEGNIKPIDPVITDKAGNTYTGTYAGKKPMATDEYFIYGDLGNFYTGSSTVDYSIKQTEAYLKKGDAAGPMRIFIEEPDGTTTAIEAVEAGSDAASAENAEGWYTVTGVKLEGEPTTTGTYIFNGKKVFIQK